MGEIDLNTYKAEKATCDEFLLKTKNAYDAALAQAKQKQDELTRQNNRKEVSKAIFDEDTLITQLLIDRIHQARVEKFCCVLDIRVPVIMETYDA